MFEAVAELRARLLHERLQVFDSDGCGVVVKAQPWFRRVGSIDVGAFNTAPPAYGVQQPLDAGMASASVGRKDEVEVELEFFHVFLHERTQDAPLHDHAEHQE